LYGLLCAADGCPVAIEVFEGNTGDPSTVGNQITKFKERFGLKRLAMVGDRGMITDARIKEDLKPAGLDWITALRAPSIQQLAAEDGPLQLSFWIAASTRGDHAPSRPRAGPRDRWRAQPPIGRPATLGSGNGAGPPAGARDVQGPRRGVALYPPRRPRRCLGAETHRVACSEFDADLAADILAAQGRFLDPEASLPSPVCLWLPLMR
jgi:hypothetical protein